jgi:hypothetical protein
VWHNAFAMTLILTSPAFGGATVIFSTFNGLLKMNLIRGQRSMNEVLLQLLLREAAPHVIASGVKRCTTSGSYSRIGRPTYSRLTNNRKTFECRHVRLA